MTLPDQEAIAPQGVSDPHSSHVSRRTAHGKAFGPGPRYTNPSGRAGQGSSACSSRWWSLQAAPAGCWGSHQQPGLMRTPFMNMVVCLYENNNVAQGNEKKEPLSVDRYEQCAVEKSTWGFIQCCVKAGFPASEGM